MTEKKQRILTTALKLFASQGYAATSTSKVAREAGVSEGLIFRHFKNKEGLLNAIMEQSAEQARRMMSAVVLASEPKEVLRKLLELPFSIEKGQFEMWRLTYALKWQTNSYDHSTFDPVKLVIQHVFETLGYEDPVAETELIFMLIDGAATALLLHEPKNKMDVLTSLKKKYSL